MNAVFGIQPRCERWHSMLMHFCGLSNFWWFWCTWFEIPYINDITTFQNCDPWPFVCFVHVKRLVDNQNVGICDGCGTCDCMGWQNVMAIETHNLRMAPIFTTCVLRTIDAAAASQLRFQLIVLVFSLHELLKCGGVTSVESTSLANRPSVICCNCCLLALRCAQTCSSACALVYMSAGKDMSCLAIHSKCLSTASFCSWQRLQIVHNLAFA